MTELSRAAELLAQAPAVAVLSHVAPEGDAIGSLLGAVLALRAAGRTADGYLADPLPPNLARLPGAGSLTRQVPIARPYPCYLVLDTSDLGRTGGLLAGRPAGSVVLNVDHHPGNSRFGDANWVDPAASSAGEMLLRLLRTGGFPVPPETATNLYAAILTDTGGFRHGNTSAAALAAAAELVEAGASPAAISQGLYGHRDIREWRLLSEALASLAVSPDGRVAWIEVGIAAQARAGVGLEATDEFIDYPRTIDGVEVAIAFKEIALAQIKVSFRSRGTVDVRRLAELLGGGGHRNAAGCTLALGLAEAKALVLARTAECLAAGLAGR